MGESESGEKIAREKGSFAGLGAALTVGVLGALGAWAMMASEGCALSNCDPAYVDYTQPGPQNDVFAPGGGMAIEFPNARFLDSSNWESVSELGSWHPFDPQHTYALRSPFADGRPIDVLVYLAVDQDPLEAGAAEIRNAALGSGNIAETLQFGDHPWFLIRNDSCAHYFFRVVVRSYGNISPSPPSPDLDAGASPDSDALSDAPSDTISDAALDVADSGPIDASSQ